MKMNPSKPKARLMTTEVKMPVTKEAILSVPTVDKSKK